MKNGWYKLMDSLAQYAVFFRINRFVPLMCTAVVALNLSRGTEVAGDEVIVTKRHERRAGDIRDEEQSRDYLIDNSVHQEPMRMNGRSWDGI
jgi:hypothetical protein